MKKLAFTITLFIFLSLGISSAQYKKNIITNDSLLSMFKGTNEFQVLFKLEYDNFDFQKLHKDTLLKKHFMKWLDKSVLCDYYLARIKYEVFSNELKYKNELSRFLLKRKRIDILDSIMRDSILYNSYKDTIYQVERRNFLTEIVDVSKLEIPNEAIYFHSFLAYPEAKLIIKSWWKEEKSSNDSRYFLPLIRMGDFDARFKYDIIINGIKNRKVSISELTKIFYEIIDIGGSYSVEKLTILLDVEDLINIGSVDYPKNEKLNCAIVNYLRLLLVNEKIIQNDSTLNNIRCIDIIKDKEYISQLFKLVSILKEREI